MRFALDERTAVQKIPSAEARTAAAGRADLFPPIEPFSHGMLGRDETHTLYWEQSGNPDGVPVVFLHGGPGAGCTPVHRRFFDPAHYRIVIFDQRGSGRSTPFAELERNTTQDLIGDLEALRTYLKIDRWTVFGGSWGSTLALAYAQAFPDRCTGLILRGIFLGTRAEIDWFIHGMGMVFPEAYRTFHGFLPPRERGNVLEAYYRRLTHPDPRIHLPAARQWSGYEASCSTLMPTNASLAYSEERTALALARIEAHYFVHGIFLPEEALLHNLDSIRQIPAAIIQGRYDMICPPRTADRLASAWPEAEYVIVPDAGHAAMEPGIRSALIAATERFKDLS